MDGEPAKLKSAVDFTESRAAESSVPDALSLHRRQAGHRESRHVVGAPPVPGHCWCISKGMAGMNSQTGGLARAVGYEPPEEAPGDTTGEASGRTSTYEFIDTRMSFPWNCLPAGLVPRSGNVLTKPGILDASPPPRLVVSCGRHGVIPALYLKKKLATRPASTWC